VPSSNPGEPGTRDDSGTVLRGLRRLWIRSCAAWSRAPGCVSAACLAGLKALVQRLDTEVLELDGSGISTSSCPAQPRLSTRWRRPCRKRWQHILRLGRTGGRVGHLQEPQRKRNRLWLVDGGASGRPQPRTGGSGRRVMMHSGAFHDGSRAPNGLPDRVKSRSASGPRREEENTRRI